MSPPPSTNVLFETTWFQRHSNYYGFEQTGFRKHWLRLILSFDIVASLGRFWVPFGRPLHFEGSPQSIIFIQKRKQKKEVQEMGLKKHKSSLILDAKMGDLIW